METLELKKDLYILQHNYIGHLAYIYNNRPFVVPITYYFNGERIIGYSAEGHKIHALRLNPNVALEVSEIEAIDSWRSVVAHGIFEEHKGSGAKALLHEFSLGVKNVIMNSEHRDLDYIHQFSAKVEKDLPVIYTIKIDEVTGKMR